MFKTAMSRRSVVSATGLTLGAIMLPLNRLLAEATYSTVPLYVTPKLSAPLADPLREGPTTYDPTPLDYVLEDRLMSGIAPIYTPVDESDITLAPAAPGTPPNSMGDAGSAGQLSSNGVVPDLFNFSARPILSTAPYTTRLIIYRPRDMTRFSGNVIIETIHPANGGIMTMWHMTNRYLARRGDIVVGVQHPRTFAWLKYHKPGRYDALSVADFSQLWGMLADTARLFKGGGTGSAVSATARRAYLTGYSFTGLIVTNFAKRHHNVNRMANGKPVFDGYLAGTGFGPMPPLDVPIMAGGNQYSAYNDTDQQPASTLPASATLAIRQAFDADGPMTRRRRYEIVGFQHTPPPAAEPGAAIPWPRSSDIEQQCSLQYPAGGVRNPNIEGRPVYEAMFRNLSDWVEHDIAPPRAPLIESENGKPTLDEYGNVRGGVRMPGITVPVASYGIGTGACSSTGWMVPFTPARLRELYGDWATYLRRYGEATDRMVAERFILPERGAQMKLEAARSVPDF